MQFNIINDLKNIKWQYYADLTCAAILASVMILTSTSWKLYTAAKHKLREWLIDVVLLYTWIAPRIAAVCKKILMHIIRSCPWLMNMYRGRIYIEWCVIDGVKAEQATVNIINAYLLLNTDGEVRIDELDRLIPFKKIVFDLCGGGILAIESVDRDSRLTYDVKGVTLDRYDLIRGRTWHKTEKNKTLVDFNSVSANFTDNEIELQTLLNANTAAIEQ